MNALSSSSKTAYTTVVFCLSICISFHLLEGNLLSMQRIICSLSLFILKFCRIFVLCEVCSIKKYCMSNFCSSLQSINNTNIVEEVGLPPNRN